MSSGIAQPEGSLPSKSLQRGWRLLRRLMLAVAAVFFALHFVHLQADFPGNNDWVDWSRYTDEGWYSDAAVRHVLFGHWYLAGDFNPAVALPVWPLLEAIAFRIAGVSLVTARALTVDVFGVMLVGIYRLVLRCERAAEHSETLSLAAPLTVLFLSVSPFFFAFERIAILEPLLATLTVLALLAASYLASPGEVAGGALTSAEWLRRPAPALALGVLLPAAVLTKPTAITLLPAIGYMVWARAGYRWGHALRLAAIPALLGALLWLGYYGLLVRPRFLEDYRYLFSANDYTGFQTEPLAGVVVNTVADGRWMGTVLYVAFFAMVIPLLVLRPRLLRNPLVPALLLWVAGYFVFLAYHNNLQSRYYLVLAVPVTALVALMLEELRRLAVQALAPRVAMAVCTGLAVLVLGIVLPDAVQQIGFLRHPTYTYVAAARAIADRIHADPTHSPMILSVSGSDLTLMTGLPSINTEFGTLDLDQRVQRYHPGWYVTWNEPEDEDMMGIAPFYRAVRIAAFPAMDDPDRNVLLLYRLDPR